MPSMTQLSVKLKLLKSSAKGVPFLTPNRERETVSQQKGQPVGASPKTNRSVRLLPKFLCLTHALPFQN